MGFETTELIRGSLVAEDLNGIPMGFETRFWGYNNSSVPNLNGIPMGFETGTILATAGAFAI